MRLFLAVLIAVMLALILWALLWISLTGLEVLLREVPLYTLWNRPTATPVTVGDIQFP